MAADQVGLAEVLVEALEGAVAAGEVEKEVQVPLYRIAFTGTEKDWDLIREAFDRDVPSLLSRALEGLGLPFSISFTPVAWAGYRQVVRRGLSYQAECVYRGVPVTLTLSAWMHPSGEISLVRIRAATRSRKRGRARSRVAVP
ncbi:MAG: hypothetical protein QW324_08720 [Thermofilaceae archaeon]